MLTSDAIATLAAKLIEFSIIVVKQVGPLALWVLIFSAFYAGLEQIFPRLGGPSGSIADQV
jgi:hypothetical protein